MVFDKKTLAAITGFIFAFIAALIVFFLIVDFFVEKYVLIERYDGRMITVGKFCEDFNNSGKKTVLLIGGSSVIFGLNAKQMEQLLGSKYDIYNLGVQGGDPVQVSLLFDCFKKIKPAVMIYTLIPPYFSQDKLDLETKDMYLFLSDYFSLQKNDSRNSFVSNDIKSVLNYGVFEKYMYLRKFLVKSLFSVSKRAVYFFSFSSSDVVPISEFLSKEDKFRNLKDPHPYTSRKNNNITFAIKNSPLLKNFVLQSNSINLDGPESAALRYLLNSSKNNNIKVVLVNLPSHPLVLKSLDSKSEARFNAHLEKTCTQFGCTYINLKRLYSNITSQDFFFDHAHLTSDGQKDYTQRLTKILQLKGVI